jgi:hypothetical protein
VEKRSASNIAAIIEASGSTEVRRFLVWQKID